MSKCHVFEVDDAVKYGIEKAVILYNLKFWLDKVRANNKERSKHEGYYWTFNSVTAFKELFPYLSEGQLQRHLKGLERDGAILAGVFNKKGYDRTKWYSMPEFKIDNIIHQNQKVHSLNMTSDFTGNDEPIPYVNADVSADVISNTESEVNEPDLLVEFWNENRPSTAAVKKEVWSKVVKTRLKTFTVDEIKTAMLTVINSQWHQQNKQVLIKNAIDSDKRCAEAIEKSNQPNQQTNNQVNNYEGQSDYNNFTQSVQQQLMQQFEREDAQEANNDFSCRDVYPMED